MILKVLNENIDVLKFRIQLHEIERIASGECASSNSLERKQTVLFDLARELITDGSYQIDQKLA